MLLDILLLAKSAASTATPVVPLADPTVAVITTFVALATPRVLKLKPPEAVPPATVVLEGTTRDGSELLSDTVVVCAGAGLSVTDPVPPFPPIYDEALAETLTVWLL